MIPPKTTFDVVLVGGGPVGLFLGLLLARQGIEVLVLEKHADIQQSPRALMYFPIVLNEFDKVGILDDVMDAGYVNREGLCFRTPAGKDDKVLARIPPGVISPSGDTEKRLIDFGVQLGQPKLTEIILQKGKTLPSLHVKWEHRFVKSEEAADGLVSVTCSAPDQALHEFQCKALVGCDGASSAVRNHLDIPFEGFIWDDFRFLAVNIDFPFDRYGYTAANHVIDARHWAVIARAGSAKEGLWRIAMGVPANTPDEEIPEIMHKKLDVLLPGPRPADYRVVGVSPYWAQEKAAQTFAKGRVALCGDAAHVCNPLTALGLTTGLVDAIILSRLLGTACASSQADSISTALSQYSEIRRTDFLQRTQKDAIAGKYRLHSMDPEVKAQRDGFFGMLNTDPTLALMIANKMLEQLPETV